MEMEQDSSKKFFIFGAIGSLVLGACIFFLSKGGEPEISTAQVVTDVPSAVETKPVEVKTDRFANLEKASFFAYNSSELNNSAKTVLTGWAEKLSENSLLQVTIEGHCDERGSDAYNVKLGYRRAQAAKEFLVSKGINASRLHTVSFGKRRPIAQGKSESSFAQNRRFELKEVSSSFAQK